MQKDDPLVELPNKLPLHPKHYMETIIPKEIIIYWPYRKRKRTHLKRENTNNW